MRGVPQGIHTPGVTRRRLVGMEQVFLASRKDRASFCQAAMAQLRRTLRKRRCTGRPPWRWAALVQMEPVRAGSIWALVGVETPAQPDSEFALVFPLSALRSSPGTITSFVPLFVRMLACPPLAAIFLLSLVNGEGLPVGRDRPGQSVS